MSVSVGLSSLYAHVPYSAQIPLAIGSLTGTGTLYPLIDQRGLIIVHDTIPSDLGRELGAIDTYEVPLSSWAVYVRPLSGTPVVPIQFERIPYVEYALWFSDIADHVDYYVYPGVSAFAYWLGVV